MSEQNDEFAGDVVLWDELKSAAEKMFNVWLAGGELEWAEECWGYFQRAGLAGNSTIIEQTSSLLRLVSLARIYQEFCGYAWDENPSTPISFLAEDLEIDSIALGILAARVPDWRFEEDEDEYQLRESALLAATGAQFAEIHACLCAAYGDEIMLFSRLMHTNMATSPLEEFEVTGSNASALQYVQNRFQ
jgi:hypothetical protein